MCVCVRERERERVRERERERKRERDGKRTFCKAKVFRTISIIVIEPIVYWALRNYWPRCM